MVESGQLGFEGTYAVLAEGAIWSCWTKRNLADNDGNSDHTACCRRTRYDRARVFFQTSMSARWIRTEVAEEQSSTLIRLRNDNSLLS